MKGSICPDAITQVQAQEWLTEAFDQGFFEPVPAGDPSALYQYKNNEFYRAYRSCLGEYHGHPCDFKEVPQKIKRKMKDCGVLPKPEYKKFLG